MGMLILAVGGIVTLVGAIMIWIPAFKEHIGWGIGSVLLFICLLYTSDAADDLRV